MTGRKVTISSSTEMDKDYIAGCEFDDDKVDIILNMSRTKSEEMVLRSVAHEITHVMLGNNEHGQAFDAEWQKVESQIVREYNK
jgi:Zn-dependent peptidase ImmA (M78 family)